MLNQDVPRLMQLLLFLDYYITNQANVLKYIKDRLHRKNKIRLYSICRLRFEIRNKQNEINPFQYLATTFLP